MNPNSEEEHQFVDEQNAPLDESFLTRLSRICGNFHERFSGFRNNLWNNFIKNKNRWKRALEFVFLLMFLVFLYAFFYYIYKFDGTPCRKTSFATKLEPENFITIFDHQDELDKFRGALILLQIAPLINRNPIINKSKEFCELFSHLCKEFGDHEMPVGTSYHEIDLPNSYDQKYLNFLEVCDPIGVSVINTTGKSYKWFDSINITQYLRPTLKQEQNIDLQFDPNDSTKSIICVHIEGSPTLGANSETIMKILAANILPEHPDTIYFLSTDGLWRYLRDNLLKNWPDQQYRDVQISNQLEQIFFAQKFCDQVYLTSPKSKVGWLIGYVSKIVHYLSEFKNSTHIIDGLTEADVYPRNWIKL